MDKVSNNFGESGFRVTDIYLIKYMTYFNVDLHTY